MLTPTSYFPISLCEPVKSCSLLEPVGSLELFVCFKISSALKVKKSKKNVFLSGFLKPLLISSELLEEFLVAAILIEPRSLEDIRNKND